MNYSQQLLIEHSRINTDTIAKAIGNNAIEFKKIIDIIYNGDAPLPQRASWLLAALNDKYPELLTPYIPLFIDTIQTLKIDGIKRNMSLVLASHAIPKKLQGKLIALCFDLLLSANETVVVKVHAMQAIANLAKEYPELKHELKATIENQLPKTTAAFHARAKHILKKF
jgi:UDP:flavonoid glycosyltransferase YjiC (YdhE family)